MIKSFFLLLFIVTLNTTSSQINIQLPNLFSTHQTTKSSRGINLPAGANIDYLTNNSFNSEFLKLKAGTLRYPGGSIANNYDWKNELNNNSQFNFKKAIHFAQQYDLDINYVLNYGTTTAQEAAEMVRICNSNTPYYQNFRNLYFGLPNPINIKKWELGNELAAKWEWHVSWLAGGANTVIHYNSGDSLYFPRTITDSLHYFGGEIWRKGWVFNTENDGMNIINSNLGTIQKINSNSSDTTIVKVDFRPIYQDSVVIWAVDSIINQTLLDSLSQQDFYNLMTQPQYLVDTSDFQILGDSAVMVYVTPPLDSGKLLLVEYKTIHPGAFQIRDSMMLVDSTIEIGYCIDFRKNLLGNTNFNNRLIQSPPRFLIDHPYNAGTDLPLSQGLYTEIIYLAEKKATVDFLENQIELDSITNSMGINNTIGIGLTEWNVRLCGDGGCNPSYNGILGGLYTANFFTQFYEAKRNGSIDLRLNNHFATIAEGNNLIHMFHYNPTLDSTFTTPQSHAFRMVNEVIGKNMVNIDASLITGNSTISVVDQITPGFYDTIFSSAVKTYEGVDSTNKMFKVLLLNQDDESGYSITVNIPPSWSADSVFYEQLSGDLTSNLYQLNLDTILISNNQFNVHIDSFSLATLKVRFNTLNSFNQKDRFSLNEIRHYPNPTNNLITLDIEDYNGPVAVQIYDLQGRLLETTTNTTVSMGEYAKGIYVFKVAYGDRVEKLKVVKE